MKYGQFSFEMSWKMSTFWENMKYCFSTLKVLMFVLANVFDQEGSALFKRKVLRYITNGPIALAVSNFSPAIFYFSFFVLYYINFGPQDQNWKK